LTPKEKLKQLETEEVPKLVPMKRKYTKRKQVSASESSTKSVPQENVVKKKRGRPRKSHS